MTCGPRTQISPSSASLASSSQMRTSVDGIGSPIEPVKPALFSGLMVAAGDVSVSP